MDYANTALLGTPAPPSGNGLGWSSVFALAIGGQYQATEKLTLRAGYLFNTNPVPADRTLLNIQLPGITQHMLTFGSSYKITDDITFSLAVAHQFRNSVSGSILQLPGSSVREDVQVDSIIAGMNVQFGNKRKVDPSLPAYTDAGASSPASDPGVQAASASGPEVSGR